MLSAFIDWTSELGLTLYPAQEEALLEVMAGKHVILNTPTGSGKSLVATAMHFRALCWGQRSFYTSPIKALINEKFFDLCKEFGPEQVGLLTGDSSINRDAPIICCTAEILSNMSLREGAGLDVDNVVMDEFHFYSDPERGVAWQVPLLTMPQANFLLMSATLGELDQVVQGLRERTKREVAIVRSDQRPVPLDYIYREMPLHETITGLIEEGRAPVYVVSFTQLECAELGQALTSLNITTREQKQAVAQALEGFRFDSQYGKEMQRLVRQGVGLHHAGLLPKYRRLVERLSQRGLLKVICGTDTLGVGVNIPIRTVLFTKLCKYDGRAVKLLTVREFKQIAGRAGRKGYDDQGTVVCQAPEHMVENKRLNEKAAEGSRHKIVHKKPPNKGYVHWDNNTFRQLREKPPEPLKSSFRIDHGMLLNLLQRDSSAALPGGGYRELLRLIDLCHERDYTKAVLRRSAKDVFKSLREAGIVEIVKRPSGLGSDVRVAETLQHNFSLHHSLSLYLVAALELLDPRSPDYALDLVTLLESILENPEVVLRAQERRAKDELIARLKAEGVEYEERMAQLEQITYPKPKAELIYETYNTYASSHPWLAQHDIHPKSIVRDLYERYVSFSDYVKEYGLQRVEGVLLRYLSQAYKSLIQTVPESFHDDRVVDILAFLRATLERVDSSLLQEWESMHLLEVASTSAEGEAIVDISADRKAFFSRIRAELHHLVRALAAPDYLEACFCIRQPETADDSWTPERFEAAMEPYYREHAELIFNHRARYTDRTIIEEKASHLWQVRQLLVDPEEEGDWYLQGAVDLRSDTNPPGMLITLTYLGNATG
jgi:superfamily II RNA helicase